MPDTVWVARDYSVFGKYCASLCNLTAGENGIKKTRMQEKKLNFFKVESIHPVGMHVVSNLVWSRMRYESY